jgi:exosortase
MTISEPMTLSTPRRASTENTNVRAIILPACLIAFGILPLVALQARALWDRPHLQAFPFAVAGGLVLAWMGTRRLGPLQPGLPRLTLASLGLCWVLLGIAGLVAWPWLGTLAAMLTLLTLAHGVGGVRLALAVAPAWAFACLAVLPPSLGDQWLIGRLQSVVTRWGSPVLDALRVYHVTEGNVIKIGSRRLLVEEACSGIHSLFAVLGGTLFFVLWTRRAWPRALFLVAAAFLWVLLGNVTRVVIVTIAQYRWGIDISHGWSHDALGIVILVGVLALTVSTDQLLRFAGALTRIRWREPIVLTARRAATPPTEPEAPHPTVLPDFRQTWLSSRAVGAAFGAVGVIQLIWLWPPLAVAFSGSPIVAQMQGLGEGDMPARLGPFERVDFKTVTRENWDAFGQFSKEWRYRAGRNTVVVSVDYPFRGWHELAGCYEGIGWTLASRVEHPGVAAGGAGPYVEASLRQAPSRYATVYFGMDDLYGTPLGARRSRDMLDYVANRLNVFGAGAQGAGTGSRYGTMPPAYQVQVLVETSAPLTDAERGQLRELFDEARRTLRQRVTSSSSVAGRKGAL